MAASGLAPDSGRRWAGRVFIRQGVETSLRRLGVDRLDLYQLHRIDPQVPLADTLGAVKELQEAGKIRHVGMSEVDIDGPADLPAAQVARAWLLRT